MLADETQHARERFLNASAHFLRVFKPLFIEYFSSLCLNADRAIAPTEAEQMAQAIYDNLFRCDYTLQGLREDLLTRMRHDGVMVGFLVNRSMFYLLEHYIAFVKKEGIDSELEWLIGCVNRFITVLESEMTVQENSFVGEFSWNTDISETVGFNSIVDIFKRIQGEGACVQFLNLYQGVPIIADAKIVSIDGESVTFQTERLQEIAMKLDGQAFVIKNEYFPKHLKADISYSNFLTNTVVLHHFIYLLNMPALQREYVRVHPDIVATVYMKSFGEEHTSGRLYDLSISGLGVLSHENKGIYKGARVRVCFDLMTPKQTKASGTVDIEAEVINIIETKGSYRYCMRIFPEREMSEKIVHYIYEREKEIRQNLEDELKEYIV